MSTFWPVAIIGRACLLPGANSPEMLWNNVIHKKNCLQDVSLNDWKISEERLNQLEDKSVSFKTGVVSVFQQADMPAHQIEELSKEDTLTQWLYYLSRTALQDVYIDKATHKEKLKKTGIIMGNLSYPTQQMSFYAQSVWLNQLSPIHAHLARHRFMSGYPIQKTAQLLGCEGVSFALDAACASALYAIQLACRELQNKRAFMMLAGGINAADDLFLHMGFTALNALSPTGQSRPLHCEADGLVPSQGGSVVVLKLLENALKDKDKIYGVIAGIGLSNDGAQKGFLVPSKVGQIQAMQKAYQCSGVSPKAISHLECHATGTKLGDRVEIDSLLEIFSHSSDSKNKELSLGILKSNIGHTITASGAAALINVLSAFEQRLKPPARIEGPSLIESHSEKNSAPFVCHSDPVEWRLNRGEHCRIAAINSFGFGGNNAHLIVSDDHHYVGKSPRTHTNIQKKNTSQSEINHSIAVTGIALRVGNIKSLEDLQKALSLTFENYSPLFSDIALPLQGIKFPPADLQKTLGQQLILLECLTELLGGSNNKKSGIDESTTSVIVGMGTDAEIARYSLKWRCDEADNVDVMPKLTSAHVLGCMPNIVANRLNYQFNFQGPSFSVSAEESSGLCALQVGVDALRNNACSTAIVGAVDLCCEVVHATAVSTMFSDDKHAPCDAAVFLILKRLEDARAAKDNIYFVLPPLENTVKEKKNQCELKCSNAGIQVHSILGYSHAVSGLLNLVAQSVITTLPMVKVSPHKAFNENTHPTPWIIKKNIEKHSPKLAFVFTGAQTSYPKMGQSLFEKFPELWKSLPHAQSIIESIFSVQDMTTVSLLDELKWSSFLTEFHASITQHLWGIIPDVCIGYCAGETNALYALGALTEREELYEKIHASRLYEESIAGQFQILKNTSIRQWQSVRVMGNLKLIKQKLKNVAHVYIAIMNTSSDFVLAGDAHALDALMLDCLNAESEILFYPLPCSTVIHTPLFSRESEKWRHLHTLDVEPLVNTVFYSMATGCVYSLNSENVAKALTDQALQTVDFPRVVLNAWNDGVRIFIEHGPRNLCARWIKDILGNKPHIVLSMDDKKNDAASQVSHVKSVLDNLNQFDFSIPKESNNNVRFTI